VKSRESPGKKKPKNRPVSAKMMAMTPNTPTTAIIVWGFSIERIVDIELFFI
jgi:hypothetical protein